MTGRWRAWLAWGVALAAVTVAMVAIRSALDKSYVVLAYLLVVLGASSRGGRALGIATSVTAFLCFNFFFLPPYYTLRVAAPLEWLVLLAFLITGMVAAQLLDRAQREAAAARQRAAEVDRLSALGAEALNAARAEEALRSIADVIRSTLGVASCEIYLRDTDYGTVTRAATSGVTSTDVPIDGAMTGAETSSPQQASRLAGVPEGAQLVEWVAESGRWAVERLDGTARVGQPAPRNDPAGDDASFDLANARTLLLPLLVRARTVGVLRVAHGPGLRLDGPQRRFLEALSYYAALGVERVRLAAVAEHAAALRQADELKNALLASVSHDLRTPLTTIKALAHDIAASGDDRAATIEEEADRLNQFVADLLDLSRLAGGALVVRPEVNAVDDLVGAALQRLSGSLDGRTIDVSLDPAEPVLLGRFDFVHALRILVNLLDNAIKYSARATPIELLVRRDGAWIDLVVADRGRGVPPSERERIFEPFYRPSGGPPDVGGTGLGLSIARGLAEAQGGSVRFAERDGGGSTFIVRLPAADLTETAGPTQSL